MSGRKLVAIRIVSACLKASEHDVNRRRHAHSVEEGAAQPLVSIATTTLRLQGMGLRESYRDRFEATMRANKEKIVASEGN